MKAKSSSRGSLSPRFRIMQGGKIALGPGKADLLRFVMETGSIGEAAKRMAMSYMRAWSLIQTMNACFKEPVVETVRGGSERGGAELTATGRRVSEIVSANGDRKSQGRPNRLAGAAKTFAAVTPPQAMWKIS